MVFGQEAFQEGLGLGGYGVGLERDAQFVLLQDGDEFGDGIRFERTVPKEHFEEHHPQRPYIGLGRINLPLQYLRCHIYGRSEHSRRHILFRALTEPKIPQLKHPIMKQDIVGLQVPVHNIVFIQHPKRLHQLFEVLHGLGLGKTGLLFEEFLEGAPVTEFIHEIEVVVGLEHLYVADDVRGGLDARQRIYLIDSALLEFRVIFEALD